MNSIKNPTCYGINSNANGSKKLEDKYKTITNPSTPTTKEGVGDKGDTSAKLKLLFDFDNAAENIFLNSIIFHDQKHAHVDTSECQAYMGWREQSDFGFVPLTDRIVPLKNDTYHTQIQCPIETHRMVKRTGKPNFLEARIPVQSQLNGDQWEKMLHSYWDRQLLEFLKFGFPLGFNRNCPLKHDNDNHKSAIDYPRDVINYLEEEKIFKAIIGPFDKHPIPGAHFSPFMTRHKPNSENRRVILGGIEKDGYMGSDFKLTFPSIDDLTQELTKIGKGAHIFKVDVSQPFRHLKVDPMEHDLLGLNWQGTYIDTCVPFGTRHGSQLFQRTNDAVRHIMRQCNVDVLNYIDDFLGYGTPSIAKKSYDALLVVMRQLGLTISKKKLIPPTTRAVSLGIVVDTVEGTLSIPPEKLNDVRAMVHQWKSKRQLQSLLGSLLYIHK